MAEDLLHEVWLRVTSTNTGPVAAPLAYLHRVANTVMVDRYRSVRQAEQRDREWSAVHGEDDARSPQPSAERQLLAVEEAARVMTMLEGLGARTAAIFRRHRIDGLAQKAVAAEFEVSLSTVESDLRAAYAALRDWRARTEESER